MKSHKNKNIKKGQKNIKKSKKIEKIVEIFLDNLSKKY